MNLKPIEMQIALNRAQEVSNVQNHLMHKPTADQAQLAQSTMKQAELQRKQSEKTTQSTFLGINDGTGSKNKLYSNKKKKPNEPDGGAEERETASHPFKGHHIDVKR